MRLTPLSLFGPLGAVERRKVPWSDKETVILLELWGDHHVRESANTTMHHGTSVGATEPYCSPVE